MEPRVRLGCGEGSGHLKNMAWEKMLFPLTRKSLRVLLLNPPICKLPWILAGYKTQKRLENHERTLYCRWILNLQYRLKARRAIVWWKPGNSEEAPLILESRTTWKKGIAQIQLWTKELVYPVFSLDESGTLLSLLPLTNATTKVGSYA